MVRKDQAPMNEVVLTGRDIRAGQLYLAASSAGGHAQVLSARIE